MNCAIIAILLPLCSLLRAADSKIYLPDGQDQLIDRKIELIARCMEKLDLPDLLLPRASSDKEFEGNMIREFKKMVFGLGLDPEKILRDFEEREWKAASPEIERAAQQQQLLLDNSVQLAEPVGGVEEIRVFVISRGFCWQKGRVSVDDTKSSRDQNGTDIADFVDNVLLKVPRIADLLKGQDALVAVGTASTEMAERGDRGAAREEIRAAERARQLASALAHSQIITCPVFTSNWGRYNLDEPDQASQREIVILGLVKSQKADKLDLGSTDLRGLVAAFAIKQRGQQLDPGKYSGPDKDPKRFVDGK
jgi:hypothetical protein